jgi:hypothetical protein
MQHHHQLTRNNTKNNVKSVGISLQDTDCYKKIEEVIKEVESLGFLERGSGYCLSMSDIVRKLLFKKGIEADLVECSVMIAFKDPPRLFFVGYSGLTDIANFSDQMENHVVCLTKTPIPFLIDTSVKNIDPEVPFACIPVTGNEHHTNLAEYDFGTSVWTYQAKLNSEIPELYQRSIVKRIKKDESIDKNITLLRRIIIGLSILTCLNFVRGSFDFYQKYVIRGNDFGPEQIFLRPNN